MGSSTIHSVAGIDLAVTDLAQSQAFYENVWGLVPGIQLGGHSHFRAYGPHYSVLSLRQADRPGIVRIRLNAHDRNSVESIYARARSHGLSVDGPPRTLNSPGGGYGFGMVDPEGRNFGIVHGTQCHLDLVNNTGLPTKITHINLNSLDNDLSFRFMREVLDFRLSDQTRMFRFLRCNSDHHSLGLSFSNNTCLNHIAFEVPSAEAVMLGIGRMRDHGYSIEWGPGRHGPGNNVFAYFCGPDEMPIEYTAEVHQIDDSYRVRPPEEWGWPPGRLDHWGLMSGPSERVKRAQSSIGFIPGGHRLD
jgi:catechol 2,3-dioxygenase-like lactoylglutathione lyase family enzyme